MPDPTTTKLLHAIRRHSAKSATFHGSKNRPRWATVRHVQPLEIEMVDSPFYLREEDGDFVLTYNLRRYDADHGLQVGDTVMVGTMPNGDLIVHDVVTVRQITKGVRKDVKQTIPGPLLGYLEVHDDDSNLIGWVAVLRP